MDQKKTIIPQKINFKNAKRAKRPQLKKKKDSE
jgi:hypothetical protein